MNKPVAWAIKADNDFTEIGFDNDLLEEIEQMYVMEGWKYEVIPLYTHPVKEQSNLVNVVKDHIEDLWRCVKTFRSYEMDNTADELEVAIKELEDAIEAHPVKELTDEEIAQVHKETFSKLATDLDFARAILRKAQEK